jgi:hypothetical protein
LTDEWVAGYGDQNLAASKRKRECNCMITKKQRNPNNIHIVNEYRVLLAI